MVLKIPILIRTVTNLLYFVIELSLAILLVTFSLERKSNQKVQGKHHRSAGFSLLTRGKSQLILIVIVYVYLLRLVKRLPVFLKGFYSFSCKIKICLICWFTVFLFVSFSLERKRFPKYRDVTQKVQGQHHRSPEGFRDFSLLTRGKSQFSDIWDCFVFALSKANLSRNYSSL